MNTFNDLIGVPFKYGKTDCWWLVRKVFKRFGIDTPDYNVARNAVEQANYDLNCAGRMMEEELNHWKPIDEPEIPCLVSMSLGIPGVYHHVGVYIGDNRFIHTTIARGAVTIERLDNILYGKRRFYKYNPHNSN
jgi:cell wall-associated NlpC family hydrolase